jgi:hypothetical protein
MSCGLKPTAERRRTLRENIHGIVELQLHLVAHCSELLLLGGYDFPLVAFQLVATRSFFRESSDDSDSRSIFIRLEGFLASVLYGNLDFRCTAKGQKVSIGK